MNSNNFGLARGRLTRDPAIFTNKDGSRKVMLTLALQDNYVGKDGTKGCQFITFDGFLRADKPDNGVYGLLRKGDLVCVNYTVRSSRYKDKNDATVFTQSLVIQELQLEDHKNASDAQTASNAEEPIEEEGTPFD